MGWGCTTSSEPHTKPQERGPVTLTAHRRRAGAANEASSQGDCPTSHSPGYHPFSTRTPEDARLRARNRMWASPISRLVSRRLLAGLGHGCPAKWQVQTRKFLVPWIGDRSSPSGWEERHQRRTQARVRALRSRVGEEREGGAERQDLTQTRGWRITAKSGRLLQPGPDTGTQQRRKGGSKRDTGSGSYRSQERESVGNQGREGPGGCPAGWAGGQESGSWAHPQPPTCPRRLPGPEEETNTAGPALTVAKDEMPWHRTACAHSKHAEGATPLL